MKKLYLLGLFMVVSVSFLYSASSVGTDSVKVTFQVDMSRVSVSPSGVYMNGSWGNWGSAVKLEKWGNVYSRTILLHPGDSIRYKFVNGGAYDWGSYENPMGECALTNDYNNRILVVPSTSQTLQPVCYNECATCVPDSVEITFLVNMTKTVASDSGVHINGSWMNWSKPVRMAAQGIFYAATIRLHPGDTIQYKYMNGGTDNWRNYENPSGSCSDPAQFNNRLFIVPTFGMTLDPVCFNECTLCSLPYSVAITFQVDMSHETVSDSGVWVNGAWCDWKEPVRLQYDGRYYTTTVRMHPGDSITYKYVNSGRFDWMKYEKPEGSCSSSWANDRWLRVPFNDLVLDPVCYDKCYSCLFDSVDITFMVNMSKVAVTDTGVYLNGSWGKWTSPVKLLNLGPIYFGTLKMHPGDTIQYKFVNGSAFNWNAYENPFGQCANPSDYNNRILVVPNDNALAGPTCFGECTICMGAAGPDVFDDWYYYGADQLPMAEHWTERNTGLGLKPSLLSIVPMDPWNNKLVCQSDSLHQSQATFGQSPTTNGPFTLVVRARSAVNDCKTLGGFFEINPGWSWPNVELKLHSDVDGTRRVSLSNDNQQLLSYPIDIREWHTYWVTFDEDSLRLFVDNHVQAVRSYKMQKAIYLENSSPYTIRMLSTDGSNRVTGELDFLTWKMGGSVAPYQLATGAPTSLGRSLEATAYPNPTTGKLILAGLPDENAAITLYDLSGKLLATFGSSNIPMYTLDMTAYERGLYLVRVQTTQGKKSFKVLKN